MTPTDPSRTGVLLVNLGTPDAPRSREVRRYLREFLSDPRVLTMPAIARKLLLEGVILPTRPRKSAAAYRLIWTEAGSPLLTHGRALRDGVAKALGDDFVVALGMRYGNPSIAHALDELDAARVDRVIALPLFPQYSAAATASALAKIHEEVAARWDVRALATIDAFFDDPGFVTAWREVAAPPLADFGADHVLFSYHGLPENQIVKSDPSGSFCLAHEDCCEKARTENKHCYRAQCHRTSELLVGALGLDPGHTSTAFQSRLGRTPWIQPFTDEVVVELAERGVKRLAVLCPAFVADCLETIEEIGMRLSEQWRELGGEDLLLVPSLNAHPTWVEAVAGLVRRNGQGG
jgi:ferrochelatase